MNKTKKTLKQGDHARYVGTRHRYLRGYKLLIGKPILDDNYQPTGYYEVFPWLKEKGRWSFVSSDVRLDELEPWEE